MGHFVNTDLRKDIEKILSRNHALYNEVRLNAIGDNVIMLERNTKLVNDLEELFEKWYDMRISACLV